MNQNEQQQLKYWIEKESGMQTGELTDHSLFFDDLGIDGEDAIEFMEKLSLTYSLDLSTYDPSKYHLWEIEIIQSMPFIPIRVNREIKNFNFNHLLSVIQAGKWFDPIESL